MKFIEVILHHPKKVLFFLLVVTVIFGISASRGVIASSLGDLFFGDNHPEYRRYKKLIRQFYSDEVFLIGLEDPNLLSSKSRAKMEKAIAKIKKISDVRTVQSILSAKKILLQQGKLRGIPYGQWLAEHPEKRDQAIKELTAKGSFYRDLLISKDGAHTAVIIELKPDAKRPAERGPQVVQEAIQIFQSAGFKRDKIHRHGIIATVAEIMNQTYQNFTRIFPFVCLIVILILYLLFKRLWPIFITLGVSLIASVWTMGFAVMLNKDINVFISAAPMLILIIATSDVIHICNAYLLEFSQRKNKREAILASGTEVGLACFMTSATTFVGFVSLVFIPVPAFQQAGIVLGFGVAMALLLAMTLTPILFLFMKEPKAWTEETSLGHRMLGHLLDGILHLTRTRPWLVIAPFILLALVSAYGLSKFTIETDLTKRMSYNNSLRVDDRYFQKHFASTNTVTLVVQIKKDRQLSDPKIFKRALALQRELQNFPGVDRCISLPALVGRMREMEKILQPFGVPSLSRKSLKTYFQQLENISKKDVARMVHWKKNILLYEIRLKKRGFRGIHNQAIKFQKKGEQLFGKTADIEVTGIKVLMGQFLNEVFEGQKLAMTFAILTILFLMIIWLKSLWMGLWSMIPNILPLAAVAGLMGLMWDQIDSDTLIILIVAIGIGVDDTIHFMVRLRRESEQTNDPAVALERAFHFTGRAIIITSLILIGGFLPFATCDYFSVNIFGTLLPFVLLIAMLADILLVPALAQVGLIYFIKPRRR